MRTHPEIALSTLAVVAAPLAPPFSSAATMLEIFPLPPPFFLSLAPATPTYVVALAEAVKRPLLRRLPA